MDLGKALYAYAIFTGVVRGPEKGSVGVSSRSKRCMSCQRACSDAQHSSLCKLGTIMKRGNRPSLCRETANVPFPRPLL